MSYDPVANPRSPAILPRQSLDEEQLRPPNSFRDSNYRDSYGGSIDSSQPLAPYRDDPHFTNSSGFLPNKEATNAYPPSSPPVGSTAASGSKRKRLWWIIAIAAIIAIIVAVAVPVTVMQMNKNNGGSSASSTDDADDKGGSNDGATGDAGTGGDAGQENPDTGNTATISGGDGSTITMEDGTTFTYSNKFGGFWVQDPSDPFNNNAQAQSWTKPLNQTWDWQNDRIRGVNLGGWLVLEPFISPALYEPYFNTSFPAVDEWTLSLNMANDTARGGLQGILEEHYRTFVTEEDFAKIAGAGLNWIRLPIPFWAVQKYADEPFLENVAWKYVLKAFTWARKYGLRLNLEFHTMPGSQNGYNHSGRLGNTNFLAGVMGLANAQRGLDYMRIVVEFISRPEYKNLVPMFGVANEVGVNDIGMDVIGSFYLEMHDALRNITGYGEGNGPYLAIADGFQPLRNWEGFLEGKDRMAMDTHTYFCFANVDTSSIASQRRKPCNAWASSVNASWSNFGVTTAGEWSLAVNDCALWLNGVGRGTRWEGTLNSYGGPPGTGGCEQWTDYQRWTAATKNDLRNFAMSSMDALQNWFFWTWKIGPSSVTGKVESPFWSYSLGLEQGWIPTDPREAVGACGGGSPASPLRPSMTGGAGSGQIGSGVRAANPWPMNTIRPGLAGSSLPTYAATGVAPTLPLPTFSGGVTGSSATAAIGSIHTPNAGCTYPDAWNSNGNGASVPACAAPARRSKIPAPEPS